MSYSLLPVNKGDMTRRGLVPVEFVVCVTKGKRTRYFYGARLKDALKLANLKKGDAFLYSKRTTTSCGAGIMG